MEKSWKKLLSALSQIATIYKVIPVILAVSSAVSAFSMHLFHDYGLGGFLLVTVAVFFVLSLAVYLLAKVFFPKSAAKARRSKGTPKASQTANLFSLGFTIIVSISIIAAVWMLRDRSPHVPYGYDLRSFKLPIASYSELKQDKIEKKTIFVSQIPGTIRRFPGVLARLTQITEKTFVNCDFYGPGAVIASTSTFSDCHLSAPEGFSVDSLFFVSDGEKVGVVAFVNCGFIGCSFRNVLFQVDSAAAPSFRQQIIDTQRHPGGGSNGLAKP